MSEDKPIMWGWGTPEHMRSEEHRKFLIEQYNRNRPIEEHVSTIFTLKDEGHNITTDDVKVPTRWGTKTTVTKYTLHGNN